MTDQRFDTGFRDAAPLAGYAGRRVLLTGQTGFKGGWLALWLARMGATVRAVALAPQTEPSLFKVAHVAGGCDSRFADINDRAALDAAAADFTPELVIHMAAQAIVRDGYTDPAGTFTTNVVGTANVLDLARRSPCLRGVIVVTSDKCYENREWDWGYRETDPLGGHDPYSASKACTELVAQSYMRCFFADPEGPQLATVRAGNVIGGGDWSPHRLIPDIMRATLRTEETQIRNPNAVRPWQHVLEPLAGYLTIGARMLAGDPVAGAWNFGPDNDAAVPVAEICRLITANWGANGPAIRIAPDAHAPHEAGLLRLDSTKARLRLGWRPRLSLPEALALTTDWYRAHAGGADMEHFTLDQIAAYAARLDGALSIAPLSIAHAGQE